MYKLIIKIFNGEKCLMYIGQTYISLFLYPKFMLGKFKPPPVKHLEDRLGGDRAGNSQILHKQIQ